MPSYNIREIKEQFSEIIQKTQAIDKPKLDDLFTQWYTKKLSFIENFNDNLIYKYPEKINVILSEEEKKTNYTDFLYKINDNGYDELSDFLELINVNDFYNNSFSEDLDYDGIYFPKGAKIIKAFKHFVDKEHLRQTQDTASLLIQQQKITGYLYLSVHPIDYLTLSENNHNWHSCHSLTSDYCAGNLSYMLDNSTVIAYVANDSKEFIPTIGTEWYSKKWRMLMHFSNDKTMVFAGRQYPFAVNAIRDMIIEYQKTNIEYYWSKWYDNVIDRISEKDKVPVILNDRYICLDHNLVPLRSIVKDISYKEEIEYVLHFNDILFSNTYTKPAWSVLYKKGLWFDKELNDKFTDFSIGSEVKCLCCGKEYLTDSSRMVCEQCDTKKRIYCDVCDEAILPEEEIWLNDGSGVVCPYCYENEISECDKCGKETHKKNIYFDEKNERLICESCFAQEEEK